jgi:glycosyltransferase involved in cell wall biosynthesis
MKVLLAYEWCEVGGVEAFMVALHCGLRRHGIASEFFFFERGAMSAHLPADSRAHFGDLGDLMKLVEREGFDLVHCNSSDWRLGISAVRAAGARLLVTAHGMVIPAWNSMNCDAIACVSEWLAVAQRNFTDIPVHRIYNGIDTEKFKPANDFLLESATGESPIVAWVGRATDMTHKRIDKLAAIAPQLAAAGVRLWIADPYGADAVERVAPEAARTLRPLAERWEMIPKEHLPQFFQQVAASGGCVLSTSVREGLGLAWVEAQACGCPAIGADVCGVNEVINPTHGGVLYPFDMPDEGLARLVLEAIGDHEAMKRRRAACATFARERFGLARMGDDYARLYREVLAEKPRANRRGAQVMQWLAPVTDWSGYIEQRWTAGLKQYEASRRLAEQGEWEMARTVARLSLTTCPTLFVKPQRLAHLAKLLSRPRAALSKGEARGHL